MQVIRDEHGTALGSFQPWAEVIGQAWQQEEQTPVHLVSDDDRAIASGIELVYEREALHQLCQFHLLREYRCREKMGTVWSPHNLLAVIQIRGLINQTT